jgi:hypothetical protein
MLKSEPQEEEAWGFSHDSARVPREAVIAEYRETDPSIIRREASAPHDHARLEHLVAAHR